MTNSTLNSSLAGLVEHVLPLLDSTLISSPKQILEVSKHLPGTPRGLLEVRLGCSDGQADLSQCFKPEDRIEFKNWLEVQEGHRWARLKKFAKNLNQTGHIYQERLTDVGLELDIPLSDKGKLTLPSLFFRPSRAMATVPALADLLSKISKDFYDQSSSTHLMKSILKSIAPLPEGAHLNYAGLMLARPENALRLQFSGIKTDGIKSYVQAAGVAKPPYALDRAIELSSHYFQTAVVCLDLAPQPRARIGLELFISDIKNDYSMEDFLSQLVKTGLCSKSQQLALEQWPGTMDPGPLLPGWGETKSQCAGKQFLTVQRKLTHIKLLAVENQCLQAKAYLEFRRHRVSLSSL